MQMWDRQVECCTCVISGQSGDILKKVKEHTKQINDIQTSVDLTMFITASKDNSAKVSTVRTWQLVSSWLYLFTLVIFGVYL